MFVVAMPSFICGKEANVVTGSFYHFFPSKELLFEVVIERFLAGYSERIKAILENEELDIAECKDEINAQ